MKKICEIPKLLKQINICLQDPKVQKKIKICFQKNRKKIIPKPYDERLLVKMRKGKW